MAHLRAHGPLDDGLLERQKQVLDLARAHRPLHQLLNQLSRYLPRRAAGCRLCGHGSLLGWHIHDLPSCYASHTKSRTGSTFPFLAGTNTVEALSIPENPNSKTWDTSVSRMGTAPGRSLVWLIV